ncbi:hypothetical protein LCGC14_1372620 [marine sediment metagenome]|uniref:Methyltransferase FkbM domain-containing protein n=1 Tax=marine sediment metagenome TaxID=412755 RepID=A0A0F9KQZ9_9ZZZZ
MRRETITKYIGCPKIILEFGSYDGIDAILYKNYFQEASVYAIEPDPIMFKILKGKATKMGIQTYQYAITNKATDTVDFYESKFLVQTAGMQIGDPSFAGSLGGPKNKISKVNHFVDTPIQVPAITIKDFCKQQSITHVDFMHIDVEGSLKKVLEGFENIRPKLIFAETIGKGIYIGSNTREEYHQMFYNLGYKKVQNMEENSLYLYKG